MDITHNGRASNTQSRSRSRSRNRNSASAPRSTSSSRRPVFLRRISLSSSSTQKIVVKNTHIDSDKSVPTVHAVLDNTMPIDFFKEDVIALIRALKISKWHRRQLVPSELIVQRISGALTNSIYKIEYHDESDVGGVQVPSLLLRVYGKNVDSIIDRELELKTLVKLSQKSIGPKLLGIFSNGRFEQFLEGFDPLDKDSIRNEAISQMIGRRMKDLHYKVEIDPESFNSPLPLVWNLIYKWSSYFEKELLPNYAQHGIKEESIFLTSYSNFKTYIERYKLWLFSNYDPETFASNYKFCHNDAQYGNLLLHNEFNPSDILISPQGKTPGGSEEQPIINSTTNSKDSSLVVIDFEYSGPNFPAFDLANHFSEWMSDYHDPKMPHFIHHDKYPSQVQMLNMLKAYVEYDFQCPMSTYKAHKLNQEQNNFPDLVQVEIKKLYNECVIWRPTVQIYWCFWGLIQNGPLKPSDMSVESLASSVEERGIDSTYNIETGVNTLQIGENVDVEEDISSADDDFDYLKYTQQKTALVLGDLIGLSLVDKQSINEKYQPLLKFVDCSLFDI